jgi:hypothetical protein
MWDNSDLIWDDNDPMWDGIDLMWDGNDPKWDDSDPMWDGNDPIWDDSDPRWDGIQSPFKNKLIFGFILPPCYQRILPGNPASKLQLTAVLSSDFT